MSARTAIRRDVVRAAARVLPFACLALGVAFAVPARAAQDRRPVKVEGTIANSDDDEQARARLYGLLVYRTVTVDFNHVPALQALNEIKRQAALPLIVRWNTDVVGIGIDPHQPIDYVASDVSAQEALEAVLEQCGGPTVPSQCTWQIRRGFIEAGTKGRLTVPAARTSRLYDITDLQLEAPDFVGGAAVDRMIPLALSVEIVQEICETIEPGQWDYGQIPPPDFDDDGRLAPRPEGAGPNTPPSGAGSATQQPAQPATPASPSAPAPAVTTQPASSARAAATTGPWASIRAWRGQLLVVAPDFMHRQVGGYPKPIPPDDVSGDVGSATPAAAGESRGRERRP